MTWTLNRSGEKFCFDSLETNRYLLDDIAHALSNVCRFGGMTSKFYSVAEHSVLVAAALYRDTLDPKMALDGLFHDATEAYIGDIVSPMKDFFPDLREYEKRIDAAIRTAHGKSGVPPFQRKLTKQYDQRILLDEARKMMPTHPDWRVDPALKPLDVNIQFWGPGEAKSAWISAFWSYTAIDEKVRETKDA